MSKRLLLIIGLSAMAGFAEGEIINREFQLKTVYLFHFSELTEWPSSLPLNICLQGSSPIRNHLPELEGQLIDGQPIHIRLDQQPDFSGCRILFLSNIEALTPLLKERAKHQHVLLVSDAEGFAEKGGMVQFALRDNRLNLVINLSAVKQAGLKFSSKLLRMSEILE
ncbi:MAG: YfiR family protein [Methylococcaceae bacterium]|nr:YfiR family protein [Methylococcaceae bacterium]